MPGELPQATFPVFQMPLRRTLAFVLAVSPCLGTRLAYAQEASASAPTGEQAGVDKPSTVDHWRLTLSPYTYHYTHKPEHEPIYMLGLERQRSDGWVWGGAYFSNSFGQPSGFAYLGKRYANLSGHDRLFAQWSVGVLYGYKPPYENEVPLNVKGISPGAVLTLGWQFTPEYSVQLNEVGTAGIMVQLSIDLY
jgi:hypothetical protein